MKKFIILGLILALVLTGLFFYKKSDEPLGTFISDVLPFGSGEDVNITQDNTPGGQDSTPQATTTPETEVVIASKLFHISSDPVSGFIPLVINKEAVVRYTDRATGHIYDAVLPLKESPVEINQVTNLTLPKIYKAIFKSDGRTVLYQSLNEDTDKVENMALDLTPPNKSASTTNLYSVSATILHGDMREVTSLDGSTLTYVLMDPSSIVNSTFTGGSSHTLLSSVFNNWRIFKLGSSIGIYTKADSNVSGFAYKLSGGNYVKLLGPLNGLVANASRDGSRLIYSYNDKGVTKLFLKDINAPAQEILPATIAEKCVFSIKKSHVTYCAIPHGNISRNEPENWYKGLTTYSDYIWRYDADAQLSQQVVDPKEQLNVDIDVINPVVSPNEDFLIFQNKKDLSLWAVRLNQ